MKLQSFSQTFL